MAVLIAPSILAADFGALRDQIGIVERAGADLIHVDVMDGRFVPNITIGPVVVQALRRSTALPLDVHLMIEEPDRYLKAFADAGASRLTVHVEAVPHLHRTIHAIKDLGLAAGVAVNPATPIAVLEDIVSDLDQILVMSVNPGFSGQTFIARTESKLRAARALVAQSASGALIAVDGGIDTTTVGRVVAAGATLLVAGNAVFGATDVGGALRTLRLAAQDAVAR
jgi:ribulose-phosphate 3-epimerase